MLDVNQELNHYTTSAPWSPGICYLFKAYLLSYKLLPSFLLSTSMHLLLWMNRLDFTCMAFAEVLWMGNQLKNIYISTRNRTSDPSLCKQAPKTAQSNTGRWWVVFIGLTQSWHMNKIYMFQYLYQIDYGQIVLALCCETFLLPM